MATIVICAYLGFVRSLVLAVALLGRVLINRQPNADSMCRPTSVIGGKADMVQIYQYVRF